MSYAAVSDIENEFKDLSFTTTSAVTANDVEEFISQEEAYLNGQIAGMYSVPVDGAVSMGILKMMTIKRVKARVLNILAVKSGNPVIDQGNPATELNDQVAKMIEDIKAQKLLLYDADRAVSGGAVSSYANENDLTQVFERDTDQW